MPVFLEVMRQTVLLHWRSRLYRVLLALVVVAGLAIPLIPASVSGVEFFEITAYLVIFELFLPFVTLFLASQAIAGDLEDRTATFLFTQPIRRIWLLLGKWLGVIVLGGVFFTVALVTFFAGVRYVSGSFEAGTEPSWSGLNVLLLAGWIAVVGYASLGAALSAFFRRPLLVGVLFLLIQGFVSRMPPTVGAHAATVSFPVRLVLHQNMDATRDLDDVLTEVAGRDKKLKKALMEIPPGPMLGRFVIVVMGFAIWIYTRREYDSRPRD